MIGHCLDPQADHEPDFATATSISELADMVAMSPKRTAVDWAEGVRVANLAKAGEQLPVERHAFLYGIAAMKNRSTQRELNEAVLRLEDQA
ncbi:hypothetical protein [Zeimonas arvi]|uniref:Uncharacterized protein n=1 Tax=Zeimonas arvi TaxID=2498847 RepID=A0A5C8NRQ1_9BURK|nr:hypothetical protein [Zeimonas arvi]TXL63561.1 hypothetical protein FHP08_17145 [Zeimonas arvi]